MQQALRVVHALLARPPVEPDLAGRRVHPALHARNVPARAEGLAGAGEHDGLDGVIRQSLAQTLNHTSSGGQTQAVDRRVVQGNDGDGSVHFVFSSHAVVPCSINRKERSCVFYFPNFAALRN
ncbi:hypothetical protein D3C77_590970 [compost metagenome]